ncbi:MAG: hypothetical protein ABEJ95_01370 [Candidatus Nanohalobium sp.]
MEFEEYSVGGSFVRPGFDVVRQKCGMDYTVIYVPQSLDFRELKTRTTELGEESLENSDTVYL